MKKEVKVVFVQGINFIIGVPNHDLTTAEWDALTDEQRELALKSGLYQLDAPVDLEMPEVSVYSNELAAEAPVEGEK